MSLLPHGRWLWGRPWRCFDAKGTSFKCGWDILIRQTRFSYLILRGSACGVFDASSSALLWRGSAGYWGAKRPCLRNPGGWSSSWAWRDGVVGLRDWPGAGGAGWGSVAAAAQPQCSSQCSALCSELGILKLPKCGLRPSSPWAQGRSVHLLHPLPPFWVE